MCQCLVPLQYTSPGLLYTGRANRERSAHKHGTNTGLPCLAFSTEEGFMNKLRLSSCKLRYVHHTSMLTLLGRFTITDSLIIMKPSQGANACMQLLANELVWCSLFCEFVSVCLHEIALTDLSLLLSPHQTGPVFYMQAEI